MPIFFVFVPPRWHKYKKITFVPPQAAAQIHSLVQKGLFLFAAAARGAAAAAQIHSLGLKRIILIRRRRRLWRRWRRDLQNKIIKSKRCNGAAATSWCFNVAQI